jgi:sulfide:quinone oxidoreductase
VNRRGFLATRRCEPVRPAWLRPRGRRYCGRRTPRRIRASPAPVRILAAASAPRAVLAMNGRKWNVTVVDRDDLHVYQPGLLFLPFGTYRKEETLKPRRALLDPRVELRLGEIDRIDPAANVVSMVGGTKLAYDVLIVATGSRILPERRPGSRALAGRRRPSTSTPSRARSRCATSSSGSRADASWSTSRRCPSSARWRRSSSCSWRTRSSPRRACATRWRSCSRPRSRGRSPSPRLGRARRHARRRRNISVMGDFALSEVDGRKRVLKSYDGRETNYDLLVSIPSTAGRRRSRTERDGRRLGLAPDRQAHAAEPVHPNVFALGDATDLPSSKAGAVAHFQSEVLIEQRPRFDRGQGARSPAASTATRTASSRPASARRCSSTSTTDRAACRGASRCRASGRSPCSKRAINHWGKLAFKWVYWNACSPARSCRSITGC